MTLSSQDGVHTMTLQISDLASPGFYADPYPMYRQLRQGPPLVNLAPHLWLTVRHDLCDALLKDRRMGRLYMQSVRMRYAPDKAAAPVFSSFARMMLLMNPPDHTRLRSLLMKAFNASQGERFLQLTQEIADRLVDRFLARGSADLMAEFAWPLPAQVICTLLDVPLEDAVVFGATVSDLVQTLELAPLNDVQLNAANAAVARLEDYFRPILRDRRKHPGEDLISRLTTVEDGDRLTEEEILANIIMLFFAGHETTSNMIGNALVHLFQHPAELAKLRAQMSLLPSAITECLRYDSSVQLTGRSALEDVEIGGIRLAAGEAVFLFLGAANRDPDAFAEPDRFLIERDSGDTKPLTFGGGIHHCLGARLAMIELNIALRTLLERLPGLRLTGLDALSWHPRNTLRGVTSLHAVW